MLKRSLFTLLIIASSSTLADPRVQFDTNYGSFIVELNSEKAPITVSNFLKYVQDGSYAGSIFHRVIPNFMIQGGGFNQKMERLPTYAPIVNEASNGLKNEAGTIAMARTRDPDSATRQFFINLVNNAYLNYDEQPPGYTVFGKVVSGFSVIQTMAEQPTGNQDFMQNVPEKPIVISKVTKLPDTKDQSADKSAQN